MSRTRLFAWATSLSLLFSSVLFARDFRLYPLGLMRAVYEDRTDDALDLIAGGADVEQSSEYGVKSLSLACQNGNEVIVKALLEAGADPDTKLNGKETALMTAARTGKAGPVQALLVAGATVDATEQSGQTALMWAAAEGHAEVVKILIEAGADSNRTLKSGFSPLFFAARNGHTDVVRVLGEAGVDLKTATETGKANSRAMPKGTTPLRIAVENGKLETAVFLLEQGGDPNDLRSGHALLHVLTWIRKPNRGDGIDGLPPPRIDGALSTLEFARLLVEKYEADPNLRLVSGKAGGPRFGTRDATPFLLASRTGDLPYLKLLHELGADETIPNADGTTPLLAACGVGSHAPEEEAGIESEAIEVVTWLLELGADVNEVNRQGETAMHGAAYRNRPALVQLLAERGADIELWNRKNRHRWTPLLIAQGFRPGNFKPSAATEEAISQVMLANGVEPPPAPERPVVGKPKPYTP